MRVAFLTSSRADYGIYLPLLKAMRNDPVFEIRMIVFGTHLSPQHGKTVDLIINDGFIPDEKIDTVLSGDSACAIASSMGLTALKFADMWERRKKDYDLVFCLGDRYEMFAAVSAATPYNIRIAHLHGGETTLGAIDNVFRHCLSLFSKLHFTATELYAKRVADIVGDGENIYNVGALSLDGIEEEELLSAETFFQKFGVDTSRKYILVTYHPETVNSEDNGYYADELVSALSGFTDYLIVVTMPNADTSGNTMRRKYEEFSANSDNVLLVENFGRTGYFTCMKYCEIVVGNSSSGIIEAASFAKYVVNIGDRQKGRAVSENIISCGHSSADIHDACVSALKQGTFSGENIYYKKNVSANIIAAVKNACFE